MITTGAKWFAGLGIVSWVLAAAYGWTTGGTGLGPVTIGFWGGVGEHTGYAILISVGAVAMVMALIALATRDGDADAIAQAAGTDYPPAALPPAHRSYWPLVGAFGVGLVVLGLVAGPLMFIAGLLVLIAVLLEWTVLAWSDHATGDPATNKALRDRLMRPFEFPIAAVLAVGLVLFGFSQVFLAVSELGAVAIAGVLATLILAGGAMIAGRPNLSPNVVSGVLVAGALGTVALGLIGTAQGEREFPYYGDQDLPSRVVIPDGRGIEANGIEGNAMEGN
jgi:hypothetical protein